MTRNFAIALCILIPLTVFAASANAQSLSNASQQSSSEAANLGNNQTIVMPANNPYTSNDVHYRTDQAQAVPPSFSSQASVQTCSAAGAGLAVQLPGGGISGAMGGGVDAGCDLKRDLDIMAYIGAPKAELVQRACLKAELAKVMAICKPKDAPQQPTSMAKPWTAGG